MLEYIAQQQRRNQTCWLWFGKILPSRWTVSNTDSKCSILMLYEFRSPGLSMGHVYLSHSHPIAICAHPIPWDSHRNDIPMDKPADRSLPFWNTTCLAICDIQEKLVILKICGRSFANRNSNLGIHFPFLSNHFIARTGYSFLWFFFLQPSLHQSRDHVMVSTSWTSVGRRNVLTCHRHLELRVRSLVKTASII